MDACYQSVLCLFSLRLSEWKLTQVEPSEGCLNVEDSLTAEIAAVLPKVQ
jgi:hypothetical protein